MPPHTNLSCPRRRASSKHRAAKSGPSGATGSSAFADDDKRRNPSPALATPPTPTPPLAASDLPTRGRLEKRSARRRESMHAALFSLSPWGRARERMFALAVRGKPRSGVEKKAPSPFPPCDLRRAALAQDRGGKPSPTRGEGKGRGFSCVVCIQNSLRPGGSGRPPVRPFIFSFIASSTLALASL